MRVLLRWIFRFLLLGALVYVVVLLNMAIFQRNLMYFPGRDQGPASAFDLPEARTLRLSAADGERIVAWYQAPAAGQVVFLYFHGNGGTLAIRAKTFQRLTADGSGLLAIDYRGYGGSTGTPTEKGLLLDGEAAYRKLTTSGVAPGRIVIIGESLGTGVAVAVAGKRPVRAVVLDSSFSSAADVAQSVYAWIPVRFLMLDSFDSLSRIAAVKAPKLFLHGAMDGVIPIAFARRLFDRAPAPKTFVELPHRGHAVMFDVAMPNTIKAWLATLPPPS